MAPKTILVPFLSAPASGGALELACRAALRFDAHLDVLHLRPDARTMIPYVGEGMSGALVEDVLSSAEQEAARRSADARTAFAAAVERHGLTRSDVPGPPAATASWREEVGREDEAIAIAGRTADLIAVSRPVPVPDGPPSTLFETALFDTGQPLLVAPPQAVESFGDTILVAWNGSSEAAGAVTAALPFLKRAQRVVVLSVVGWIDGVRSAPAAACRLGWHGIDAELEILREHEGTIGEP